MELITPEDVLNDQAIDYKLTNGSSQIHLSECPWCGGSKIYLRADDGRGMCFSGSCGEKFNLFSLTRQILGTSNRDTFQALEALAKGRIRRVAPVAPKVEPVPEDTGCVLPANVALPTPEGATHPYLIERGVTAETQRSFDLRWCEVGSHRYVDKANGEKRTTSFNDRIIIPVCDLDGVIKTFQGRDVTGEHPMRYLFPSTLPGTGRFLYGAHLCRGKERALIGEGPFDVFALHQAIQGIPALANTGVMGSFGLSIGMGDDKADDQLARLRKLRQEGLRELVFVWDGEHGALMKACDYGRKLRRDGFKVRIALLPPDKDPADCTRAEILQAVCSAQLLDDTTLIKLKLRPPYKI